MLIAGPCVVESKEICHQVAEQLLELSESLRIPYIFKASIKKANRSKGDSFRGIGEQEALDILASVKSEYQLPILTDVHETADIDFVKEVIDVIQIPAFLCRQTDLLEKAAQSGLSVNVKKGQFMAPEAMEFVAQKIANQDNHKIFLTERGSSFGHHDLVVDFRGISVMQQWGYPVIYDVTHSLQVPNQSSGVTGGKPEYIEMMAKAGLAVGVDGLFMEIHPKPSKALSDGANMLALDQAPRLLQKLAALKSALNGIE